MTTTTPETGAKTMTTGLHITVRSIVDGVAEYTEVVFSWQAAHAIKRNWLAEYPGANIKKWHQAGSYWYLDLEYLTGGAE